MRLPLLIIAFLMTAAPQAFAQYWPLPAAQQQVPSPQYYGAGVMPTPTPWFRQPLPYFQQPMPMFAGYRSPFMPNPYMYPQAQQMPPFGNPMMMAGMSPFGFGGQPQMGLNLNFNLDQLFGNGGLFGGGGDPLVARTEPFCEVCEQRRHQRSAPARRVVYEEDDTDDDLPDTHTEARSRFVRQPETLPAFTAQTTTPAEPPSPTPGDRVADGDDQSGTIQWAEPATRTTTKPRTRPSSYKHGLSEEVPDIRADIVTSYRVRPRNIEERKAQTAPIWNLFITNFMACVPAGCEPAQYAVEGSRSNRSCHPQRRAIDVHAVRCNGRLHRAIDNDPIFTRMVACMGGRPGNHVGFGRMAVLWHQNHGRGVTGDHYDHAHFSAPTGCLVNGRRVY